MSKQQDHEATLFERFRQRYEVPSGRVDHLDRPDFLVHSPSRVIGIELTDLYQQHGIGRTQQAQESERAGLLAEAKRQCIAAGVPSLNVAVFFAPHQPIRKSNRAAFAAQIASLVRARMPPTNEGSVYIENLWCDSTVPNCVLSIRITRFPWLREHDWSAPEAGYVQTECIGLIQSRLDAKAVEYAHYRTKCDECWLLIVAGGWRPSSLFKPSRETLQHQYTTPFQRVFLMEHFSGSLSELHAVPQGVLI